MRSMFMALLIAAPATFAAEPNTSETVTVDFGRACGALPTDEELAGPDVKGPKMSPKYPPTISYPKEAKKRGEAGVVEMLMLVNEEGYVTQAKLWKSSGHSALDRGSLEVTKEFRLEPGRINGTARCMWMSFTAYWGGGD